MNFIYSFGGPVQTGAVSNGTANQNSSEQPDLKVKILDNDLLFKYQCSSYLLLGEQFGPWECKV